MKGIFNNYRGRNVIILTSERTTTLLKKMQKFNFMVLNIRDRACRVKNWQYIRQQVAAVAFVVKECTETSWSAVNWATAISVPSLSVCRQLTVQLLWVGCSKVLESPPGWKYMEMDVERVKSVHGIIRLHREHKRQTQEAGAKEHTYMWGSKSSLTKSKLCN